MPSPEIATMYADDHLVVVDKPAGLTVIPARDEPPGDSLHHRLQASRGERLWVCHRIDRETSGVVVLARTAEAHREVSLAFEHRRVEKRYVAFAGGALRDVARVDLPLCEARRGRTRPAGPGEPGGKPAVTELEVARRWRAPAEAAAAAPLPEPHQLPAATEVAEVSCRPLTGRHHQIRVHLRAVGAPLVADPVYGRNTRRGPLAAAPCPRLALHAAALTVPTASGPRTFTAPLPADLAALRAWLDAAWEAA